LVFFGDVPLDSLCDFGGDEQTLGLFADPHELFGKAAVAGLGGKPQEKQKETNASDRTLLLFIRAG